MFEYLPLIAFQIVFAAAGFAILYRIIGGRLSAGQKAAQKRDQGDIFREASSAFHA